MRWAASHHGTRGYLGKGQRLPQCHHCVFPTLKLSLAEGHRAVGEQRDVERLGSVVGSMVGKSERCGHLALMQVTSDAKTSSPSADVPPSPFIKQMKLGYDISNLSGCSPV